MTNPTGADVQSYLNRQQQAAADVARFNDLPQRDHDEADAVRAVADTEAADLTEKTVGLIESYQSATNEAVEVRMAAVAGDLSISDAQTQLAKVRTRLEALRRHRQVLAQRAAKVQETRSDPATEAARLIDKYPALRRG